MLCQIKGYCPIGSIPLNLYRDGSKINLEGFENEVCNYDPQRCRLKPDLPDFYKGPPFLTKLLLRLSSAYLKNRLSKKRGFREPLGAIADQVDKIYRNLLERSTDSTKEVSSCEIGILYSLLSRIYGPVKIAGICSDHFADTGLKLGVVNLEMLPITKDGKFVMGYNLGIAVADTSEKEQSDQFYSAALMPCDCGQHRKLILGIASPKQEVLGLEIQTGNVVVPICGEGRLLSVLISNGPYEPLGEEEVGNLTEKVTVERAQKAVNLGNMLQDLFTAV